MSGVSAGMAINYYTDLKVWQKAMDLVVLVYQAMKSMPKEEMYALSSQIRRAAVSIPANIAEGQQRNSTKEYVHFLYVAKGSLGELETEIIICERLGYLNGDQTEQIKTLCSETGKMLNGLIKNLQNQD